jgi:hypothetical protein
MAKCTPRQITSVTNEQKRASTIWRKKKILFSVTIRKQDRPARSLVAILAMLPQLLIMDLVLRETENSGGNPQFWFCVYQFSFETHVH